MIKWVGYYPTSRSPRSGGRRPPPPPVMMPTIIMVTMKAYCADTDANPVSVIRHKSTLCCIW
jgi:hypothetical protein